MSHSGNMGPHERPHGADTHTHGLQQSTDQYLTKVKDFSEPGNSADWTQGSDPGMLCMTCACGSEHWINVDPNTQQLRGYFTGRFNPHIVTRLFPTG